jgi:hypothetical protein
VLPLCELASGDVQPEPVAIPPNLARVLAQILERIDRLEVASRRRVGTE